MSCDCQTEIAALQAQIDALTIRLNIINPADNTLQVGFVTSSGAFALTIGADERGAFLKVLGGPIRIASVPGPPPNNESVLCWLPDGNGNLLLGNSDLADGANVAPYTAIPEYFGFPTAIPSVPNGMSALAFDKNSLRLGIYVNQGANKGWHYFQGI